MFKTYERKNFKTYGTDEHVLFETYETKGHKVLKTHETDEHWFVRLSRMSLNNNSFVCRVCLKKVRLLRMSNQLLYRLFGV